MLQRPSTASAQSLDAYLVLSGRPVRDRRVRLPRPAQRDRMLMSIELMLNAVNLSIIAFGAFTHVAPRRRVGDRADRDGRRGGRGDGRPRDRHRHLPQPEDAARRRVRRDAAVGAADAPAARPSSPRPRRGRRRPRDLGIYATLIPLLVLLPILGFAFTALFGRRLQLRFGRCAAEIVPVGADRPRPGSIAHGDRRPGAAARRAVRRAGPRRSRSGPGSRPATSPSTSGFHVDALTAVPADRRHHDRHARPRLLDRVHGPRPGTLALLRLPQPVHVLDAAARARGQLPAGVRGAGSWSACRATC